jgi:hypothetical protein
MSNAGWYAVGLALGVANKTRHRARGSYTTPRPFSANDLERTIDHAIGIVDRLQERGPIEWTGRRILEIGPGSDLATGAVMLARGAASYHAVDAFDNRTQARPDLYSALNARLGSHIDPSQLGFTLADFPAIDELDGEFDVIVSNATLEHIEDVPRLFAALAQRAAPGCQMVHHVDGQTHMRWVKDRDPLNILRYTDEVYHRLLAFPGAPNRLRAGDYLDAARAADWSPQPTVAGRRAAPAYIAAIRPALPPRFRSRSDLDALTFTVRARR